MRVLLVEPDYRRGAASRKRRIAEMGDVAGNRGQCADDGTLWYPPLGLLKLARFHRRRGDEVRFVNGCDPDLFEEATLFSPGRLWDRVYITTLFTFDFAKVVRTIRFYRDAVGGTKSKIFVGGVMASLMPEAIFEETGVYPITGLVTSPRQLKLKGRTNIDRLPPDHSVLDARLYAINETYYAYASRGCTNRCPWCGVPKIEPEFVPYIDIKPMMRRMRREYGDKPRLKLMDNNVLASPELERIVSDLLTLGYGRGEYTRTDSPRARVVDFNQGLDASFCTEAKIRLLSKLNIKPMRIAFDRVQQRGRYIRAVKLAHKYGFSKFSNYMLFNFQDAPRDLYDRLMVNIRLNEEWIRPGADHRDGEVYSYPMRYAPISEREGPRANRKRDFVQEANVEEHDWLRAPVWTPRFIRSVEIMKGAAHGAIPPTPGLALRAIGETFEEFLANLYMPEELLRNRNKHERHVSEHEPKRQPGTGKVEEFREFVLKLLRKQDSRFRFFHEAVTQNSVAAARGALRTSPDEEVKKWLKWYLKK